MTRPPSDIGTLWAAFGALVTGFAALHRWPFPDSHPLLQLVDAERSWLFDAIRSTYVAMLFATPFWILSLLSSLAFIFFEGTGTTEAPSALPPYPDPARRKDLFLVLGEVHHVRRPGPAAR